MKLYQVERNNEADHLVAVLEKIRSKLVGIAVEDLTTAERQIKFIVEKALGKGE